MKIINRTFAVALASVLIMSCLGASGQNCSKKKLASNELKGKFDYRGQSLFRPLNTGDSITLNVVLYSKQNYRLFVVGEQKLGNLNYQIYVPSKKFTRVVQSVEEKKVPVYKKDPLGFYLYDKNGQKVKIGEQTIQDTIWSRETTSINDLVFDSRTSDQQFWEATPVKTQSITIKVYVAPAAKKVDGCVGLYVGCEYSNASQFIR
ncbi:MAG: hypothetical protein J5651_03010 [Salinivirgaceae bacterium]|nr:hypothetical protein [Salinivirgaceae bacterium]MBO7434311.1 hypothetical protein [Salinivirgaceae bacterium]MBR5167998.1 hypothetical protein [Salinivirgaceae bacterium]